MLIGHSVADKHGTLLAVDPQICEITQREERELIGVGFQTLTHPADCQRNVIAVADLRVGGGPVIIRKRYVRPDGSAVWSQVQVSRLRGADSERLVSTVQLIDPNTPQHGPEKLWQAARWADALTRRRRHELGDDPFADHGWEVLLQIYLAEAEGRSVDVASISKLAAIQQSSTIHWLALFERKKLIERTKLTHLLPQLTSHGVHQVESILAADLISNETDAGQQGRPSLPG